MNPRASRGTYDEVHRKRKTPSVAPIGYRRAPRSVKMPPDPRLHPRTSAAGLPPGQSQLPTGADETSLLSSLSGIKTCPKCEHLVRELSGNSIHSTLAYSRCRCHRLFVSKMKELQVQFAREQAKRMNSALMSTPAQTATGAEHEETEGDVPHLPSIPPDVVGLTTSPISLKAQSQSLLALAFHQSKKDSVAEAVHITHPTKVHDILASFPGSFLATPPAPGNEANDILVMKKSVHRLPPLQQASQLGCSKHVTASSSEKQPRLPGQIQQNLPGQIQPNSPGQIQPTSNHQPSKKRRPPQLTDMAQCIPAVTQHKLRAMFAELDKNGDGHLSFLEFLGGLPFRHLSTDKEHIMKQFYQTLSGFTYFGCREFIVCYCIAEVLLPNSRFTAELKPMTAVDQEFLIKVLRPFIGLLVQCARDWQVTRTNVQEAIMQLTESSLCISIVSSRLEKIFNLEQDCAPLLDLVALAPYYLKCTRQ